MNNTSRLIVTSGFALLIVGRILLAAPQVADDVAKRIDAAPKTHPRLYMDGARAGALKRKIAADPELTRAVAHITACADAMLEVPPVKRKKLGRRLLGVSRTCLKRVGYLAFAHQLTGKPEYLRRAQQEMLAVSAFKDWNPSHFLDVAEMTAALAIGYDWLHAELEEGARAIIRKAIVEKGLKTSLRGGWWVTNSNNWNQVCHGGLTMGALAVLEDEPELAKRIVARAVANVPRALHEYEPDGAYPEGPGYWKYGTTYNVLLIDTLRTVLGTDFGLTTPALLRSADYYLQMTGPTGLFFNYSDCGRSGGIAPAMYWFAARRKDDSLLFRERAALADFLRKARPSTSSANRLFPFLFLWGGSKRSSDAPSSLHYRAGGVTPVAVHRSGWDPDATFVALKGGSPGVNHAHMDIGVFVMDADGVRWAHDLGSQNYHSLESNGIVGLWDRKQTSQRWTVFRLNNLSHNTLVVDGKHQVVKGSAPITKFSGLGPAPHTIVDLTSVYAKQLAAARRGVQLRANRSVIVQDELETSASATVRWGMLTQAEVHDLDGGSAVLRRQGKSLTISVLSPASAELRTYETATPPSSIDHANPGTRMIGFEVKIPASTRQRLVVLLTPGGTSPQETVIKPLADW